MTPPPAFGPTQVRTGAPAPARARPASLPALDSPDTSAQPPIPATQQMTPPPAFAPTQTRKRVAVVKKPKNGSSRRTQKKRINRKK